MSENTKLASPQPVQASPVQAPLILQEPIQESLLYTQSLQRLPIQRKLTIGAADDPLEVEADRMADRVMRMPETFVQRKCNACEKEEQTSIQRKPSNDTAQEATSQKAAPHASFLQRRLAMVSINDPTEKSTAFDQGNTNKTIHAIPQTPFIQAKCTACEDEEQMQRKPESTNAPSEGSSLETSLYASKGNGTPLADPIRSFMEHRIGSDFSHVRVHQDATAQQMSDAIQAQAFTHGSDIYFNTGKYNPDSSEGKHLLAHELTHVVQQQEGLLPKHIQRAPACEKGHMDGSGKNIPLNINNQSYGIWTTWATGDTHASNFKRVFPKWLDWRYGSRMSADDKKYLIKHFTEDISLIPYMKTADLVVGCQYLHLLYATDYIWINNFAHETTTIEEGGPNSKAGKKKLAKKYNVFGNLKDEQKQKILKLLKDWLGDPQKDDDKDKDKKAPEPKLSSAEIQALLQIADHPHKDELLKKLKEASKGGDGKQSLEQLLANIMVNEAKERFNETNEGGKADPVESRPVHGMITHKDPSIVPNKEVAFYFETQDDRDALRVPWISIKWKAQNDSVERNHNASYKKFMFDESASSHYSPIREQGLLNDKFFKVKFPEKGVYVIEAIVNHNFFLPNSFFIRVAIEDENTLLKETETEALKGFAKDGDTTYQYKFKDASSSYDEGTRTIGKIEDSFKGVTKEQQLKIFLSEKERIENLVKTYKEQNTPDAAAFVEWATKYLAKMEAHIQQYTKESEKEGATLVPCKGAFVSRTAGVGTRELLLSCFIRKITVRKDAVSKQGVDLDPIGHPEYEVTLLDHTQLFENENYTVVQHALTADAAMEKAFVNHSSNYPFGTMSMAFQRFDEATGQLSSEYIKYGKVTDTLGKDIKSVLFSAPMSITVNIAAALLTIFPPTTGAGIAIAVAYNGANTISELEEAESKGTLTTGKVMRGVGSIALDIIPIAGGIAKANRIISIGRKTYLAIEAAQFAGQAYLMYQGGMEQVENVRNGVVKDVAELEEEIKQVTSRNPADPQIKVLQKRQKELITKGQKAIQDTFDSLIAEQGFMMVSMHVLNQAASRKFGSSKAALQESGLLEHQPGQSLKYDYEKRKITGDSTIANPEDLIRAEKSASYDYALAEATKSSQADLAQNSTERKALVEKLLQYGDVEITIGNENKFKTEGGKYQLQIGNEAKLADIHAVVDKSGVKAPSAPPTATATTKPTPHKTPEGVKSPAVKEIETGITPTKERHEYILHEDGSITRCSDQCSLVLQNIAERGKQIKNAYPKEDPKRKTLETLQEEAASIQKEATANAKKNPTDETGKKAKAAKEDELLNRAKDLEIKIAQLESNVIPDIQTRANGTIASIETTVKTYTEYEAATKKKLDGIKTKMTELSAKQASSDALVRDKATLELLELEKKLLEAEKKLNKRIENTKKPDISETFEYKETPQPDGSVVQSAKGKLGIPGEVKEVRSKGGQESVSEGTGDDAGHLIANLFGGAGDARNLSMQHFEANEFGTWKQLENMWARKLKEGIVIHATVSDTIPKGEKRPTKRQAVWTETTKDGKTTSHKMTYMNPHSPKSRDKQGIAPTVPPGTNATVHDLNEYRKQNGLPAITPDDLPEYDMSDFFPSNDI